MSILCYHSISEHGQYAVPHSLFTEHMDALTRCAEFVSLDRALHVLGGEALKKSEVVLTIDDGYKDALSLVEVTKKYNIPVTLFVLSEPENVSRKELSQNQELLSWEEIKELQRQGWVIGSHSGTHRDFRKLSDDELRREIIGAKARLEEKIGRPVDYFSYPKGRFDRRVLALVQEAGYKGAVSILPGCVTPKSNRFILPRTVMNRYDPAGRSPLLFINGPKWIGSLMSFLSQEDKSRDTAGKNQTKQ